MSIKLSETPREHYTELFETLIYFRGVNGAKKVLIDDVTLSAAFPWVLSKKGHHFWETIDNGKQPTVTTTTTKLESLEEVVAEAEARGFAVGVWTKFGKIGDGIDHELSDDGSFFYRNIKVRGSKGKWCKPNVKPKKGGSYDRPNDITGEQITKEKEIHSAIHEVLERMFKTMHE